jgi:hypothetical protein
MSHCQTSIVGIVEREKLDVGSKVILDALGGALARTRALANRQ